MEGGGTMRQLDLKKSFFRSFVGVYIAFLFIMLIPMVSMADGGEEASDMTDITMQLTEYAGVFSTAVTLSVNPAATLAVLSIFGAIENAAIYSPDSVVMNNIADFLNGIPVVREMGKTPLANPYAAVILVIVAVAWFVVHSSAVAELVSKEISMDKVDRAFTNICYVALSILPLVTNDALAADPPAVKGAALTVRTVRVLGEASDPSKPGAMSYVMTVIVGIATIIVGNCVYSCVSNWETIMAAIPAKGTSFIWQIVKVFIHAGLLVLQMFAPVISFIVSIHLVVICIFLLRILKRLSRYYSDVYVFTILSKIFKRNREVPRIEKRVPRRLRKLYPSMELAMSVYTFHGYARLAKYSRVWLIKEGEKVDLVYKRLVRKPYIISWPDLCDRQKDKAVYLEQCLRFMRIRTEDRKIELVMSNRYKPEAEMLKELLRLGDYSVVKKENKETKKLNRKLKRQRKKHLVEVE